MLSEIGTPKQTQVRGSEDNRLRSVAQRVETTDIGNRNFFDDDSGLDWAGSNSCPGCTSRSSGAASGFCWRGLLRWLWDGWRVGHQTDRQNLPSNTAIERLIHLARAGAQQNPVIVGQSDQSFQMNAVQRPRRGCLHPKLHSNKQRRKKT